MPISTNLKIFIFFNKYLKNSLLQILNKLINIPSSICMHVIICAPKTLHNMNAVARFAYYAKSSATP